MDGRKSFAVCNLECNFAQKTKNMKSYFIFLSRNKLYSAIEMLGMSLALGFVLLLTSYARTEFSVGSNQPLSKQLYAIGMGDSFGLTLGTAEEFFPSIPEIESWTRIALYGNLDVTVGEEYFQVKAAAADTNFLQLFDYNLIGCDRNRILSAIDEVIISEKFAKKAFADENPVGRTIAYNGQNLRVTGVIQDFGARDVFEYCDVFFCIDVMMDEVSKMDQFSSSQTFVTLADGANPDNVAEQLLDKYCSYWILYEREASSGSFLYGSTLTRLDKIYFRGFEHYDFIRTGDKKTVEILLIVALVLLVSAIFNYINLTVAQAGKRAKEMATRRLMGELRVGILCRYIRESFLFTFGCFLLGYVVAIAFRPVISQLLNSDIIMIADFQSVIAAIVLVCFISLISGLLPAVISVRLKPIDVVKGTFRFRNKMILSKVFILCQIVICTVLIASSITMKCQMHHLVTLPKGYNTENLISLYTFGLGYKNMDAQNELARRLRALPCVEEVGMYSCSPLHCSMNGLHLDNEEKRSWIAQTSLDSVSFKLLGFKVIEKYSDPLEGTCWMTEETQKRYGITAQDRGLGRIMNNGKHEYECCGIIADYRSRDVLYEPMEDTHNVLINCNTECLGMLIKITGNHKEALAVVSETWHQIAKEYLGIPKDAEMNFLEDELNSSLTGKRNTMMLVSIFMILSILISALGLFAMSIYYSEQQKKSIAMHKIAGANTRQAVLELSRPFIITSLIAIAIATPISIKIMQTYLEGFFNRIDFPWWVLPVAAIISLAISVLSILGQAYRTANANPIESIKTE